MAELHLQSLGPKSRKPRKRKDIRTRINVNSNLLGTWEMLKRATDAADNAALVEKLMTYYIEHQYPDTPPAPTPGSGITEPYREYFKAKDIDMLSVLLTNFQDLIKQLDSVSASTSGRHHMYEPNAYKGRSISSDKDFTVTVAEFSEKLQSFYDDLINVPIQVKSLGILKTIIVGNVITGLSKKEVNEKKRKEKTASIDTDSSLLVQNADTLEPTMFIDITQSELVKSDIIRHMVGLNKDDTIISTSSDTIDLQPVSYLNDNDVTCDIPSRVFMKPRSTTTPCSNSETSHHRTTTFPLDSSENQQMECLNSVRSGQCTKTCPLHCRENQQMEHDRNYEKKCIPGIGVSSYIDDSFNESDADTSLNRYDNTHSGEDIDTAIDEQDSDDTMEYDEDSEHSDDIGYNDNVNNDPDYVDEDDLRFSGSDSEDQEDHQDDGAVEDHDVGTGEDQEDHKDAGAGGKHSSDKASTTKPQKKQTAQKLPTGPFHCQQCSAQFDKKGQLNKHMGLSHPRRIIDNSTQCDECGKSFNLKASLKEHLKNHSKQWKCDICGARFATKKLMLQHSVVHSDNRNFLCVHCGMAFKQSSALWSHIKHKHYPEEKEVCVKCNKAVNSACMKRHWREVHENVRPFICEVCNKAFANKTNLRVHVASHERGTI